MTLPFRSALSTRCLEPAGKQTDKWSQPVSKADIPCRSLGDPAFLGLCKTWRNGPWEIVLVRLQTRPQYEATMPELRFRDLTGSAVAVLVARYSRLASKKRSQVLLPILLPPVTRLKRFRYENSPPNAIMVRVEGLWHHPAEN